MRILLLLLLASTANATTLATLRDDCRAHIKDTGTSRQRFTDTLLLRFLNEGQENMVNRSRGIRNAFTFELAVGVTYYAMPDDFLIPVRVTRDDLLLPQRSIQSLDKIQEWEPVNGLPINYFVHYASRTKVGFYPWPATTSDLGRVKVDYIASSPDLVNDSDEAFNGIVELQTYAYALSFYCAYRAGVIDGQLQQAGFFMQEYERNFKWFDEAATDRQFYRPGAEGNMRGRRP